VAQRRYSEAVHPIERLRYVARAGSVDAGELVREAAGALGGMGSDPTGLVLSCKRLVDRQPAAGPLWWLCARMLTAADPRAEAWRCVGELDDDPTARRLADDLPDEARVTVLGWPELVAEALPRRGDLQVLVVDAAGDGAAFARRLRGADVDAEEVAEGSAGGAAPGGRCQGPCGRRSCPASTWTSRGTPTWSWCRWTWSTWWSAPAGARPPTGPPPGPTAAWPRSCWNERARQHRCRHAAT
jgi:hypothetical protein